MKSQDIFLLLKLVSLHQQNIRSQHDQLNEQNDSIAFASRFTARSLENEIGLSKSEVSLSLNRCINVGLAIKDRKTSIPRANVKALSEFIIYGIKYVFPAQVSALSRGIPTSFAAPVLQGKIMSAGETIYVWPDARASNMGQAVQPLYKSVPFAVNRDPILYEYLALVDSIRLGNAREASVAIEGLKGKLVMSSLSLT